MLGASELRRYVDPSYAVPRTPPLAFKQSKGRPENPVALDGGPLHELSRDTKRVSGLHFVAT